MEVPIPSPRWLTVGETLPLKLLPMHLKPKADELLSSWLMRLSHANGFLPHSFCSQLWPGRAIWNRDIDHLSLPEVTNDLARLTAITVQRAEQTTLHAYEGTVFENYILSGRTRWILPVGVWHRVHLRYGLQYCPDCLATDETPYFRRAWRLAFVTECLRHRRPLLDRCPSCAKPINFHHNKGIREDLIHCYACGTKLTQGKQLRVPVGVMEARAQRNFQEALQRGWMEIDGRTLYSHLYFEGIWALTEMLLNGRGHTLLKDLVGNDLKALATPPAWHQSIEDYSVPMRRVLTTAVFDLTSDWPGRFLRLAHKHEIRASDVKRELHSLPFWLHDVLRRELFYHQYEVNDTEVSASIRNLVKMGLPLTNRNIYAQLGHFVPKNAKAQLRRVRSQKGAGPRMH